MHRQVSQAEVDFHRQKSQIAMSVLKKLQAPEEEFDKADGSDGLEPPSADVPEQHFKRRLLVNEVLA
eukprot:CAMPEP_0172855364 /NCGR_PEP_ID=MMETSP1075-20121228/60938_1 /TAXON_ID=2916 /ORGANISM="Ceratium fusus, Strain PA161109" /LENGTH=66 /DNA_ID=CAMNT_0013702263 /DNA_START=30 /DNA_END=227 /DNA_ORIENTATION=+